MTKQDIIPMREMTYTRSMFFNPENAALVCKKHNEELFGGKLVEKKVSRGAGCWYCLHEGESK